MDADNLAELATLTSLVEGADLAPDAQHAALWCLGQMPKQYQDLCQTYDSRFGDAVLRLAQAALQKLAEHASTSPDAGRVTEAFITHLKALHERLGLQGLDLKPLGAPSRRVKKAA